MIEIVFNESAAGSLKQAQNYGKGKFCTVAMLSRSDDAVTGEAENRALKLQLEREKLAWKMAEPMVGKASDVFCFSLALDVGDISGNCTGENRIRVLSPLLETFSENDGFLAAKEILKNADERMNTVKERLSTGETLRLWYSEQPDEMCGLCWFASQYSKRNPQSRLYAVKLPSIEYDGQTLVRHSGWGGMPPGEWHKYLKYQEEPSIGLHFCSCVPVEAASK